MRSGRLSTQNKSTNTDSSLLFTENLIQHASRGGSVSPSGILHYHDRKLIEGWTVQHDSEEHSLSMLHTLSRNIRSYEKIQRKLSQRRNLRQLKEQYKNIRTTHTSRPQTTRKIQQLKTRKKIPNAPLADFTNESRNLNRRQEPLVLPEADKRHIKAKSKKVIEQLTHFDAIREVNQKRMPNVRYNRNQEISSLLNKSIKVIHRGQLSRNIECLQQRLKQLLVAKNSVGMKTHIVDLTLSVIDMGKGETQSLVNRRTKGISRSRSPLLAKCNQSEFQDSRIFNKIR